ncbi:MAG: hypothetical protein QXI58_01480 [Candidatus Micrarchaeia archaeon]
MAATIYEYVLGDINLNITGGVKEGTIYKIPFAVGISKKKIIIAENEVKVVEYFPISSEEISGAYLTIYDVLTNSKTIKDLSFIFSEGYILGFYTLVELFFDVQKMIMFTVTVYDQVEMLIAQKTYTASISPAVNFLEMKQLIDIASAEDTNMHILIEEYTPDNKLSRARMKLYADSQQSVLIREYQITATYDERGRLLTYNVRPIL